MERNGKGMSAKGTALTGLGLRHPSNSSGCRNRIKCECPKDARNGALELAKRRGNGFVRPEMETALRGFNEPKVMPACVNGPMMMPEALKRP